MFRLCAPYSPAGDQPQAIEALVRRIEEGCRHNVLLGVTGSGKTFTIANVIARVNRPTLVVSHNKTLAAQLYSEFKQFFPENAVEYFVSYFDYYQPEAYLPATDTYIEKDSAINEEIDRLRSAATASLLTRRDTIVVASVSCIYGLGSPEDYLSMICSLEVGQGLSREAFLGKLVEMQYERNDVELGRGRFRVRGDVVEVLPATMEVGLRVEFFGDEVERLAEFDPVTGGTVRGLGRFVLFPASHYVTPREKIRRAIGAIREELDERVAELERAGKLVEAQRLRLRTNYDLEQLEEMGYCNGIENYSRHLAGRAPGSRPFTLLDFFPEDALVVVDESHATLPQIQGMYNGDRARKVTLVEHGFRLPSALDNRPLRYEEFQALCGARIYVSATPGPMELELSGGQVVEQIIRPTGLLDPEIVVRPLRGQVDDIVAEARETVERGDRVLILTLTKRTAEDLADYLRDLKFRVRYLHSEIDTIERVEILRDLRQGRFDVLVGINLLREGLDLPEVALVGILDADKEGYLRSERSLIQTAGRAARHLQGRVILYADKMTPAIRRLIEVTAYRREKQAAYNAAHGVKPRAVRRTIEESLRTYSGSEEEAVAVVGEPDGPRDLEKLIAELEAEMKAAAKKLLYEKAALIRDQILELRAQMSVERKESGRVARGTAAARRGK
ncbi:MAG: excinuclease ABC subunit UvrB [Methylacidiphilales bacterium]|nr:excinuclease ABC subunit UvrB [Candidatus Methylacidiphilales bacterium]MDW8349451.1 excinuclease ABC subunit UvrB [Verrucomicrobiae bacterium]